MTWLLKWIGVKALKALLKKALFKMFLAPSINRVGDWIQEHVDDPDTDEDEKFVQSYKNFAKYFAQKQLDKL